MPTLKPPPMTSEMASQTDDDRLDAEDQAVGGRLPDADPGEADAGVHRIGEARLPQGVAHRLVIEQADHGHAPQRFDQGRLDLGAGDDRASCASALEREGDEADQSVEREGGERDHGQSGAVEEHHQQGEDGEDAVEQGRDRALGQRLLDRRDRLEARQYVADMALLEPVRWAGAAAGGRRWR